MTDSRSPRHRGRDPFGRPRGAAENCAVAVTAVALALLVAACGGGKAAGQRPSSPASPNPSPSLSPSSGAAAPSPSPSASAAAHVKRCPAGPVAAPHHSLTLPRSIGGYRRVEGPARGFELPPISRVAVCKTPELTASYQNSAGSFVDIYVGHHASRWRTFHSFWGLDFALGGEKVVAFAAGPLGGQVGCETTSMGTVCAWLDSDTFGELVGNGPAMSPSATARLMLRLRSAIEHRV